MVRKIVYWTSTAIVAAMLLSDYRPLLCGRWCADMEHTAGVVGPSDRLLRERATAKQLRQPVLQCKESS
jgi:hypothetical protein